jgi:hypothetical protein
VTSDSSSSKRYHGNIIMRAILEVLLPCFIKGFMMYTMDTAIISIYRVVCCPCAMESIQTVEDVGKWLEKKGIGVHITTFIGNKC